jgi:hypothetical protein
MRMVTKIEKYELWCGSAEDQVKLYSDIQAAIDTLDAEDERKRSSSAESDASGNTAGNMSNRTSSTSGTPGKARKWAHAKKMSHRHSRHGSDTSSASTATGDSQGTLGLKDLEARYKVEKQEFGNAEDDKKEFIVQFGEGPMGFSLSSGAGVGVIVGRLAVNSFAELGGISIGDRIVSVGDSEIGLEEHWQVAVDAIKSHPRPLTIKLERYTVVSDKVKEAVGQLGGGADSRSSSMTSGGTASTEERNRSTSERQRKWARKRDQKGGSAGARLLSLKELEGMYSSASETGAASLTGVFDFMADNGTQAEKRCVDVLREMYETEKTYVNDLRTMVGEYILPLRRTTHRIKCKDVTEAGRMCEHKLLRSACTRMSSETRPVVDPEDLRGIFMNVETLVRINTELLNVLQTGMLALGDTPTVTQVVSVYAPAFVKVMPFFKMYSLYCHAYPMAIDSLLVCRSRNKDLDQLLRQREGRSQQTSLQSLLIKPVQRICKYPLLFNELIKNIMPYVQEAAKRGESIQVLTDLVSSLEAAAQTVQRIASSVNQKVGERENLERLMEVYVELGGETGVPKLVQPHRRFVSCFDVNYRTSPFTDKNEIKRTMLYVFTDLLIFAKGTSSTFAIRRNSSGSGSWSGTLGRGVSIKKAISSTFSGTLPRTSSSGKHRSSNGRSSSGGIQQQYKMTDQLNLERVRVGQSNNTGDAGLSFQLKHVVRQTPEEAADAAQAAANKAARGRGRRSGNKESNSSVGSAGTMETQVHKFEVWCRDADQKQELLSMIDNLLLKLDKRDEGQREAEQTVGPARAAKKKSWANKKHARSRSTGTNRSSDTGDVLESLANKYTNNKNAQPAA